MKGLRKFRLKYLLTGILTAFLFFTQTWKSAGSCLSGTNFYSTLTSRADTIKPGLKNDSILKSRIINPQDTSTRSRVFTNYFEMSL